MAAISGASEALDERLLARISDKYVAYVVVPMPPTWKEREPVPFTFVLFDDELTRPELHEFFRRSAEMGIRNPRPVSRRLLEVASLFHPLLYARFTACSGRREPEGRQRQFLESLQGYRLTSKTESVVPVPTVQYYLQSLLFLSGCTLSAAVVQNRYSSGTIESKLQRLWQACQAAKRFGFRDFEALQLEEFVVACDADAAAGMHARLIEIKKSYGQALRALIAGVAVEKRTLRAEPVRGADERRFGFVGGLKELLGVNMLAVLLYGSAVTSESFADYDVIVVVRDTREVLRNLAGSSPSYDGKDLNIGIYDPDDFTVFQTASGDNLDRNARCLYGEVEIPVKPAVDLMARNFSFAFIRLRQLLGMAGFLAVHGSHFGCEDPTNLYEYFAKIPMHIMKGVRSVAGEPIAKEYINAWTAQELGYDLATQMGLIHAGRWSEVIVNAYFATQAVLHHLNERYQVFEVVPQYEAPLWQEMERPVERERSRADWLPTR